MTELEKDAALAQIDAVFTRTGLEAERAPAYGPREPGSAEAARIVSALVSVIQRLTAPGDAYREAADRSIAGQTWYSATEITTLHGLVVSLRADIEAGYTHTLVELVHANVAADFMEMAQQLLDNGYKDAGAVIGGSVLEQHLRQLAETVDVDVETSAGKSRKADTINADLVKAGAYNKLEQKQITAQLGLRNHAAHGEYDEYDAKQVASMLASVRDFMIRHPA